MAWIFASVVLILVVMVPGVWRKVGVILLALVIVFFMAGCSEKTESTSEAECREPSNPFNDEGGHDAGFKWAEEKGEECPDSHGTSFQEGCEEFYRQHQEYENCQAEKHK